MPGFRSKEVILVTTLLDLKLYPAQELEKLDLRRWNVESHFRQIKTMLGMDVLRCCAPEMALEELAMHRIAYNLIRALTQRAALTYDVGLGANFLQRLSGQPASLRRCDLCHALQAS